MIEDKTWASAPILPRDFFDRRAEIVAPDLIGCFLVVNIDGQMAGGMIVETEAYDQSDYASHCYSDNHRPARPYSKPMSLAGGHLYLYCNSSGVPSMNFVCDRADFGSAILIRAIEPMASGKEIMRKRREPYGPENLNEYKLCNGPANTSEALGINEAFYKRTRNSAVSLFAAPFELRTRTSSRQIVCGPRIGIEKQLKREPIDRRSIPEAKLALARHWRFGLAGSQYVSASFTQYIPKS